MCCILAAITDSSPLEELGGGGSRSYMPTLSSTKFTCSSLSIYCCGICLKDQIPNVFRYILFTISTVSPVTQRTVTDHKLCSVLLSVCVNRSKWMYRIDTESSYCELRYFDMNWVFMLFACGAIIINDLWNTIIIQKMWNIITIFH